MLPLLPPPPLQPSNYHQCLIFCHYHYHHSCFYNNECIRENTYMLDYLYTKALKKLRFWTTVSAVWFADNKYLTGMNTTRSLRKWLWQYLQRVYQKITWSFTLLYRQYAYLLDSSLSTICKNWKRKRKKKLFLSTFWNLSLLFIYFISNVSWICKILKRVWGLISYDVLVSCS